MDDIELYNEFEAKLEKLCQDFENKNHCEVNVRLIEVKPNDED